MDTVAETPSRLATFRWNEGADLNVKGSMTLGEMPIEVLNGFGRCTNAGAAAGAEAIILFDMPNMSLTYIWFKSGFPVPHHSHNCDCTYYITGGSLIMNKQTLSVGDGFYAPCDVPYGYIAGPDGVELLEFRNADTYDIRFRMSNVAYWDRVEEAVTSHVEAWATEQRPSTLARSVPGHAHVPQHA